MWGCCPYCQQMVLGLDSGKAKHRCPKRVIDTIEERASEEAEYLLLSFWSDLDEFWDDSHTKFYDYLAQRKMI